MCTISTFLQVSIPKSNVVVLLCNPGALRLLVNMPEGLREDPYHWTKLPSSNKDYYHFFFYYYYIRATYLF